MGRLFGTRHFNQVRYEENGAVDFKKGSNGVLFWQATYPPGYGEPQFGQKHGAILMLVIHEYLKDKARKEIPDNESKLRDPKIANKHLAHCTTMKHTSIPYMRSTYAKVVDFYEKLTEAEIQYRQLISEFVHS
jgi:hypothetical protein